MNATIPCDRDIHTRITDALIAAIERGADDWTMPWRAGQSRPVNIASKQPYRGVNVLSLWSAAIEKNYAAPIWGTYRQWTAAGAQVRKGEKATPIVFYREVEVEKTEAETGEPLRDTRLVARASSVFNAYQVDGYAFEPSAPEHCAMNAVKAADAFVAGAGAEILHGGERAFYAPATDHIQTPPRGAFVATETSTATEGYYATLLHELTHWSGASHRLDRQFGRRFGDDAYAMEELCAELGAAFLCADLGVGDQPRADHAAYLTHWLRVMKADKRAIFTAASHAEKAVAYLGSLQSTA